MNTEGESNKNEMKRNTLQFYNIYFFPFLIFKRNERKTNNLKIDLHGVKRRKKLYTNTRTHAHWRIGFCLKLSNFSKITEINEHVKKLFTVSWVDVYQKYCWS